MFIMIEDRLMRVETPEQKARHLERQRVRRAQNGNAATRRYERTKAGKLMRIYRNMRSRVEGVQWRKAHLYAGKPILPKEEFYAWALECGAFHELYAAWVESGYSRKLAPSIDRIDSDGGYTVGNMEWVTHSENSRRGSASQRRKSAARPSC